MVVNAVALTRARGLVVAETLSCRGSPQASSKLRTTVDFPAPLGPERMISRPVEVAEAVFDEPCGEICLSFKVLNQLTHSLNGALNFDNMTGDLSVVGFGANRVGFPKHLLNNEV